MTKFHKFPLRLKASEIKKLPLKIYYTNNVRNWTGYSDGIKHEFAGKPCLFVYPIHAYTDKKEHVKATFPAIVFIDRIDYINIKNAYALTL